MAKIKDLVLHIAVDHESVYPTWKFDEPTSEIEDYTVMYAYQTGDYGVNGYSWWHGTTVSTYAIPDANESSVRWTPPEEATYIRVQVKANSKTRKINDQDVPYWTCDWAMASTYPPNMVYPDAPDAPTLEIDGSVITATLQIEEESGGYDDQIDAVQFDLYNGNQYVDMKQVFFDLEEQVNIARVQFRVASGGDYMARCRVGRNVPYGIYATAWSPYGPFSSSVGTAPATPAGFTTIRAASSTSVYLAWDPVDEADTYDIEYTTNPDYFGGSNATTTQTGIETTKYTLTGMESGDEYYFRLRAVNDNGSSEWSTYKSVIIGKPPAAPTTWSSTTTAIVGDPLNLYWVHNAEDGSWATFSQIELYFDGVKETHTIESDQKEDEDSTESEHAHTYAVDTSKYPEGTIIKWRVRTAGVTKVFGDWSIQREITVYAKPNLYLTMTNHVGLPFDVLNQFPIKLEAYATPKTQEPIGYHITITAETTYDTIDYLGRPTTIKVGDTLMTRYITSKDPLDTTITASDVDLADGQGYSLKVVVSMNSGLTAEDTKHFSVKWTDESYEPDMGITIDTSDYTAMLTPFCNDSDGKPIQDVLLSVYRREFDGTFTEIAKNIDASVKTLVTDPHPSLYYARYRIVAMSVITGAISYYDPPAYPVLCDSVLIQWDEEWQNLGVDEYNSDPLLTPLWSGSTLKIRGNIDVSENVAAQSTLVNYIGRTYPVSYYGTAVDSSATWNMDVPKYDKETLFALRRLQVWCGDVYVREPSGSGYWANVSVSFSQKHLDLVIPVTLTITRVEGGM